MGANSAFGKKQQLHALKWIVQNGIASLLSSQPNSIYMSPSIIVICSRIVTSLFVSRWADVQKQQKINNKMYGIKLLLQTEQMPEMF